VEAEVVEEPPLLLEETEQVAELLAPALTDDESVPLKELAPDALGVGKLLAVFDDLEAPLRKMCSSHY
jgi:hypothetical protein